jgi:hypothetical protein
LEQAVAVNDALGLRGFMGALLARLGWAYLHVGEVAAAELAYHRALDIARRLGNGTVVFLALTGLAALRRLEGRHAEAGATAIEALAHDGDGSPPRLSNRVSPRADTATAAAVCTAILGCLAADEGRAEPAAQLLGRADDLHRRAGSCVPPFLCEDVTRACEAAMAELGPDAYEAAFERGRRGSQLGSHT